MTWVRVDCASIAHPKVIRVARLLGVERPHALGLIVGVWAFGAAHAPAGRLASFEGAEIESWVGWAGREGALVEALVSARLLDETEHGLEIHDWPEYTSGLREAERKRRYREKLRTRPDDPAGPGTDARRTRDGDVPPTDGRTDERTDERTEEGASRSALPTLALRDDPAWQVPPEIVSELETLFPHLPAAIELAKASAWLAGVEPKRRWTAKGAKRALLGWFDRAAKDAKARPNGAPRPGESREIIRYREVTRE